MSNFLQNAIHPKTGDIEPVEMLDDCFGHHGYGVLFQDGSLYYHKEVITVDGNVKAKFDDFNPKTAYEEGERVMKARKINTII